MCKTHYMQKFKQVGGQYGDDDKFQHRASFTTTSASALEGLTISTPSPDEAPAADAVVEPIESELVPPISEATEEAFVPGDTEVAPVVPGDTEEAPFTEADGPAATSEEIATLPRSTSETVADDATATENNEQTTPVEE